MDAKAPVMLVVLVDTARLCWYVGFIASDGRTVPLLRSEEGDLEKFRTLEFDDQVAFFRHRFCGVLQRGCDRVWTHHCKACQFVFIFEGTPEGACGKLLPVVAEHLSQWMLNPPVVVFRSEACTGPATAPDLKEMAGRLDDPQKQMLATQLLEMAQLKDQAHLWEVVRKKVNGRIEAQ